MEQNVVFVWMNFIQEQEMQAVQLVQQIVKHVRIRQAVFHAILIIHFQRRILHVQLVLNLVLLVILHNTVLLVFHRFTYLILLNAFLVYQIAYPVQQLLIAPNVKPDIISMVIFSFYKNFILIQVLDVLHVEIIVEIVINRLKNVQNVLKVIK